MADEKSQSDDRKAGGEAIPEVEAEIVESDAPSPREEVFGDAQDASGAEAENDSDPAEEKAASKRRSLTPGLLIFILFAVFALAVFAFWRMQSGGAQQTEDAAAESVQRLAQTALPEPRALAAPVENEAPPASSAVAEEDPLAPEAGDGDASAAEAASDDPEPSFAEADAPTDEEPQVIFLEEAETPAEAFAEEAGGEVFAEDDAYNEDDQVAEEGIKLSEAQSEPSIDEAVDDLAASDAPDVAETAAEQAAQDAAPAAAETAFVEEEDAAQPVTTDGVEIGTAKLENDVVALKDELRTETDRLSAALDAERRKNAALEAELADLREGFSAALAARDERTAREFAALRARFEALETEAVPAPAPAEPGAAEAAAAALVAALEAGAPYEVELEDVEKTAPQAPAAQAALEVLRLHAASGVEPKLALKSRFGEAARLALAAAAQSEANGMMGNLTARAISLVSVRPADPRAGDSPGAVMSRAEDAVERDDFALALAQLEALPPPARDAMEDWIAAVRAREEAFAAVDAISRLTLSRLPG